MNAKQFRKHIKDTFAGCEELLIVKNGEYAHGDDMLDNFKRNGVVNGISPLTVWNVYASKHVDAITTFVKDVQHGQDRPRSESILGRFDDAINYFLLGKALAQEELAKQSKAKQ